MDLYNKAWRRGERALTSGRLREAGRHFNAALAIIVRFHGADLHPEAAIVRDQLALCAMLSGNLALSRDQNARATAILDRLLDGRPDIELIIALTTGARIALEARDPDRMETLLLRADAVAAQMHASSSLQEFFVGTANRLADCAQAQDMPLVSAGLRMVALERLLNLLHDPYHSRVVACRCEVSRTLFLGGRIQEAVKVANQVLDLTPHIQTTHFVTACVLLLECYRALSQRNNALGIARQLESVCKEYLAASTIAAVPPPLKDRETIGSALDAVMRTYSRCREHAAVERLIPYLLRRAHQESSPVWRGGQFSNIGMALLGLERFEEAAAYYRRAIDDLMTDPGRDFAVREFLFQSWMGLGRACGHLGKLGEAERHYDIALSFAPKEIDGAGVLDRHLCLINRAAIIAGQGRNGEAISAVLATVPLFDYMIEQAERMESEHDLTSYLSLCRNSAGVLLGALSGIACPEDGLIGEAVCYCLRSKLVATRLAYRRRNAGQQPTAGGACAPVADPAARETMGRIVALLDHDEVLLEYFSFGDSVAEGRYAGVQELPSRLCAVALRRDRPAALVFFDDKEGVREDIANLRRTLLMGEGALPLEQCLRKLADRILAPLDPWLEDADKLIIAPDGALAGLPFELLPGRRAPRRIDEQVICYITSGLDLLAEPEERPSSAGAPLVIGDPDFEFVYRAKPHGATERPVLLDTIGKFGALKGARAEAALVAASLGVEPLLGADASKAAVLSCRSPEVLHFATHGFAAMPHDEDSYGFFGVAHRSGSMLGIGLAGANVTIAGDWPFGNDQDGLLVREDIARLDLRGTTLVSFSACQTARGDLVFGEGLWGLGREALLSGAGAVLSGLWDVPDLETCQLISRFYALYAKGVPARDALHQAKRELDLRGGDMRAWAGFVLTSRCHPRQCVRTV